MIMHLKPIEFNAENNERLSVFCLSVYLCGQTVI